ncbi:hypothetical protein FRC12_022270 [Ceratobasidium sp. 428]|nr:hypothetical protein FRC12_022270 [Ceratobasidium sp. 428]
MAYLDVFSLKIIPLKKWTIDPPPPNPDNDSDWTIDIDRIATFELPRIRSVTEIPLYASSWTHPGDLAISCVCSIDPSFSPSPLPDSPAYSPMLSEASKYHPASVFEVSNSGRVLRFALDLPFRYGSGEIDLDACSWLLVPVYVFSYFIQRVKLETPLVEPADTPTFAWDEWGHLARWIHNHKLSDFSWTVVTSGTRSLLMHESVDCSGAGSCNLCGGSPVTPDSPKIWILDFNRRKLQQLEPQNRARTPATTYAGVYQPALADAYTPDVEWLHNARDAIAPYIKTPFWHEFIRKFTDGDSLEVWIDDEHGMIRLPRNSDLLTPCNS